MPSTINGVGTHYYGKRNVHSRPGICPFCKQSVNLVSYDTRLWFVILFIPIIPIGRKRIIDMCPACRRHYVADWHKWETSKQLDISGALEKYRSDPTPETAIEAHRAMLAYRQVNEAAEFRKLIAEKFSNNAKLQVALGIAMLQLGETDKSQPYFERALALRPDMPDARIGVAEACIRSGQLDRARELLDFMQKPGAAELYSLASLERLALAYQGRGQHNDALPLFARLLEELPVLADNAGFCKTVRRSEIAAGKPGSVLPKGKFGFFKRLKGFFTRPAGPGRPLRLKISLVALAVVGVLIIAGLLISNEVIRRHRKLHIYNAAGPKVKLNISGRDPITLYRGLNIVDLPEGHYDAHFSGDATNAVSFDISCSYFHRWSDKSLWLLNPSGAGLMVYERAVYEEHPGPPEFHYIFGKLFERFDEITHPFTDLPRSVRLQHASERQTLTTLFAFKGEVVNALYMLQDQHRSSEALDLAEWSLGRNPADREMMLAYEGLIFKGNRQPRMQAFLGGGLTNRPVRILWHRACQDLQLDSAGFQKLAAQYDQLLQAEPDNSALLYLRGRVCDDAAQGSQFFERSRLADTNNPYPLFALGYDLAASGNWARARPLLDRAVELAPDDAQYLDEWKSVCMGQGDFAAAEAVFRKQLGAKPIDYGSAISLCEILAAENRMDDAKKVITDTDRAIRARDAKTADTLKNLMISRLDYVAGNFPEIEQRSRADRSEISRLFLFWALVEQNRLDDALRAGSTNTIKDTMTILGTSLAALMAGQKDKAAPWIAASVSELKALGHHYSRASALLAGDSGNVAAALDDLKLVPPLKAAIAANLAYLHPEARKQLLATAQKLNVERVFPYHLVNRACASAAGP